MAQLTFAELISTVPLADWKARIVSIASAVGLKTENWAEGGYTRTLVALFAQLCTTAGDAVRTIAMSGFLDTAEGAWLTFLAKNMYGVERIEATYAAAPLALTLTNSTGGLFIFDPGDIVVAHLYTKKTYRTTSGGTLNPGAGQTLALDLAAEEPGNTSGAGVGTITVMVTTSLGVTCTNTVALAGLNEESDADLRQRCRDSLAALSVGGPKRAYVFVAKSARRPDGGAIGINRVFVMPAIGDGTGTVYIASASGAVTAPDVAFVQALFDERVTPEGFTATAVSATNKPITAPCLVYIPASLGLTEAAAQGKVRDALQAYVESLPIGGTVIFPGGKVYWRALLGVIENAIPGTLQAQLVTEADVAVAANEVPTWAGTLIDASIYQI